MSSSSTYPEHRSPERRSPERRSPELLQPLKHEACALCTVPDGPDLAVLLGEDQDRTKPPGAPCSTGSGRTEPGRAEPTPRGRGTLRLAPGGPALLSPMVTPRGTRDGPARTVRQAKRARVENIIRDMVGSSFSSSRDPDRAPEDGRGDQGPRDRPPGPTQAQRAGRSGAVGCWSSEDLAIKSRLQNTKGRPLVKSRSSGGLPPEDWEQDSDTPREDTSSGDTCVFGRPPPGGEHTGVLPDPPCSGSEVPLHGRAWGRSKVRVPTAGGGRRADAAAAVMADILKYELSRAVSVSVDSIFSSMPLLGPPPAAAVGGGRSAGVLPPHRPPLHHSCLGAPAGPPPYREEVCGGPLPEVQTQALSLVVQRPLQAGSMALCRPPHQHRSEPRFLSSRCTEQHPAHQGGGSGGPPGGATDPVSCTLTPSEGGGGGPQQEAPGGALKLGSKVRCKVNSRSVRGAQSARHFAVEPVFLEVRPGARGPQSLLMSNLFSLNDGLTTSHLKKAKLMFFYTRYPSSVVLKTFFHDVQFTRCITSQLIKWFSNFREFYYIQMEKQARQALAQGVAHAGALAVGRDSELFRALSTHYNKASDFQVPERFLEVAGITLREFYLAVSLGRDVDPSWKKPIYKVICKLDSNVPEEFKTHYPD